MCLNTSPQRAFAVPHGEHAVVLALADQVHLLRAPHGGGREVLVHARHELHVVRFQVRLGFPQVFIEAAQGRAAIAGNEAGRVQARHLVAHLLHHRQAHQRLDAGQEDGALGGGVFVVEAHGRERAAAVWHGGVSVFGIRSRSNWGMPGGQARLKPFVRMVGGSMTSMGAT
jgi:hypothetical protein